MLLTAIVKRRSQRLGRRAAAGAIVLCALLTLQAGEHATAIEPPDLDSGDIVVIRADRAWETRDERGRALHFEGNFSLDAPDWFVRSETAEVRGDLDDPNSVTLGGAPARLWMLDEAGETNVEATAGQIIYLRAGERLKLERDAVLIDERNTLRSSSLEYDLDKRVLVGTGSGGVEIVAEPKR
ncbi:MAG: LptA/OstA family protein [Pseudomonadota bacterium]